MIGVIELPTVPLFARRYKPRLPPTTPEAHARGRQDASCRKLPVKDLFLGRFCDVCGRARPNEHYGGRGQRARICRACRRQPVEIRTRALLTAEILDFLDQSNISSKNLKRLTAIEAEATEEVSILATLVRRIAEVMPLKRKRWKRLKQQHPQLLDLALVAGLLDSEDLDRLGDFTDCLIDREDFCGIWIEPRPGEVEPTFEELCLAAVRPSLDQQDNAWRTELSDGSSRPSLANDVQWRSCMERT